MDITSTPQDKPLATSNYVATQTNVELKNVQNFQSPERTFRESIRSPTGIRVRDSLTGKETHLRNSHSPAINALNENTVALLGLNPTGELNNEAITSERSRICVSNYQLTGNTEGNSDSARREYASYQPRPEGYGLTEQSYEALKNYYEAGLLKGNETATEQKRSSAPQDNTLLRPDSYATPDKKLLSPASIYSNQDQSTLPRDSYAASTLRSPEPTRKRDYIGMSEFSTTLSPPMRRDPLENRLNQNIESGYQIVDPEITKTTIYTIENVNSSVIKFAQETLGGLALPAPKTPERGIKEISIPNSPLDELNKALSSPHVRISKIMIETVEKYPGNNNLYQTPKRAEGPKKLDIIFEQITSSNQNEVRVRNNALSKNGNTGNSNNTNEKKVGSIKRKIEKIPRGVMLALYAFVLFMVAGTIFCIGFGTEMSHIESAIEKITSSLI